MELSMKRRVNDVDSSSSFEVKGERDHGAEFLRSDL